MLEDALMESAGGIRTHRGWLSGVAAICNGSIVSFLVLFPLLHPASLPKQTLSMLLAAPAPPAQLLPHIVRVLKVAPRVAVNPFTPPRFLPDRLPSADHEPPPAIGTGISSLAKESGSLLDGLPESIGNAAPPRVRAVPARKPVISSGVMEGRKLSGAEPRYSALAIAAHVQGTVVLAAMISKTGWIENLRIVSGPSMLAAAAEDAVQTWRYRPYLLNGEP
jgi:protein TonB